MLRRRRRPLWIESVGTRRAWRGQHPYPRLPGRRLLRAQRLHHRGPLDRDTVTSGQAATGKPWQYYDLGHGLCSYTFFEQCPHRMACAKPLTDDERAAIDDGQAAVDKLLERLNDVPTPAGPTPRQLTIPATATRLPIADITRPGPRP
jgi:hypothetical protein